MASALIVREEVDTIAADFTQMRLTEAEYLRIARLRLNRSQFQLAVDLGTHPQAISYMETGKTPITDDVRHKVCQMLEEKGQLW